MELVLTNKDEIKAIFFECLKEFTPAPEPAKPAGPQYLYSIAAGARYYHVSNPTFQAWKNAGIVAFKQIGRKLIIDVAATDELLEKYSRKRK